MSTLPIILQDEHGLFIEEAIRAGKYGSPSEVIAEALETLKERELGSRLAAGLDELDRGQSVVWDPERLKAALGAK